MNPLISRKEQKIQQLKELATDWMPVTELSELLQCSHTSVNSYAAQLIEIGNMETKTELVKSGKTNFAARVRYYKIINANKPNAITQQPVYLNKYDQLIGRYILIDVKQGQVVAEQMVMSVRPKSERVYVSGAERI